MVFNSQKWQIIVSRPAIRILGEEHRLCWTSITQHRYTGIQAYRYTGRHCLVFYVHTSCSSHHQLIFGFDSDHVLILSLVAILFCIHLCTGIRLQALAGLVLFITGEPPFLYYNLWIQSWCTVAHFYIFSLFYNKNKVWVNFIITGVAPLPHCNIITPVCYSTIGRWCAL